jgi:hypothetical protein
MLGAETPPSSSTAVERVHIDAALFERFGNCELRSVRVMTTGEGGGDGELQHLRLSPDLRTQKKYCNAIHFVRSG